MEKLSKDAYGGVDGKAYKPYQEGRTAKAGGPIVLIIGLVLTIVFAASTAYSGMKAGMTVAAGIPGAILGSGILTLVMRKNTKFLSKNILQGMSSAGESVAGGLIYVLPAIILIGSKINFWQGVLVGGAAVLVSIGFIAFVQDYLLIEEHGKLMFPESMAISETLVASDAGGNALKFMGIGFGIGGIITAVTTSVFGFANNVISYVNETFYKWKFEMEINPMLSAIGFIVGLDIAIMMFAGSILANFGVAPLIGYFSEMAKTGHSVWNNPAVAINQMQFANISGSYVKYVGAGMMISGGLIGAIRLIPTIISSIKATLAGRKSAEGQTQDAVGIIALLVGIVVTFVGSWIMTGDIVIALIAGSLSILLSVLFVIVSGRLTGTIGTSNLPVSGMTIAALVILTLVFLVMGWKSQTQLADLLLFGTFIVVAISIAGGYAQTQKVTHVVGGNFNEIRKYYIVAALVGVVTVTGVILLLKDQLAVQGDAATFAIPQANLMAALTKGILGGALPWHMVIVGVVLGVVLYMIKVPVMTFAIGFYLPISTSSIILVGALVRILVEQLSKRAEKEVQEERMSSGVSLSSGLVAGASIIGLLGIILQVSGAIKVGVPTGFLASNWMAWLLLAVLIVAMVVPLMSIKKVHSDEK
ncbi:MAG: OPT/YSL family transporter [Streptococcaceae bacterium]|nr:OPT/YSL family transporter [Streptococcaceae bacterium]